MSSKEDVPKINFSSWLSDRSAIWMIVVTSQFNMPRRNSLWAIDSLSFERAVVCQNLETMYQANKSYPESTGSTSVTHRPVLFALFKIFKNIISIICTK